MNEKFRSQELIVQRHISRIQKIFDSATDRISDVIVEQGKLVIPPSLAEELALAMDEYYFDVITKAVKASQVEAHQDGISRLAKRGDLKKFRDLEDLFRDKRQWQRILKRSATMGKKLREVYMERLRAKFQDVLPKLNVKEHGNQKILTPGEVKAEMREAWKLPRARVETIFRTETTNYYADAQVAYFDGEPEIIGFLYDSVRDTSRTDICRSRHGLVYRPGTELLKKNKPALHYGCRSHLIPLANTEHNRKMLNDPQRDPTKVAVAPLPPGWRK